ncbi:CDP-glycerol glycerophosphotransferase family protein [Methanobacterium sp. MBAC-LM]|uniref:CDP-glycerol glycerophosphotransferase family protein n=1 Tax=Methanobacterium sp. MBAC-LM TaxID=3412034 RepID=UPI003C725883
MNKLAFFKRTSYHIMAIFFYLSYLFPINKKKILLIMTHDNANEGNVGSTYRYFQKQDPTLIFKEVTRDNYTFKSDKNLFKNLIYMFISVPYHMATSRTIFMDNVFLPFSAVKLKKNTQLIQLWHGTGALKKFGLDYEEGWVKKLAVTTNKNTTHFIVGSSWMKEVYKTAFGAEDDKIFNIGCPRTDIFFNKAALQEKRDEFFSSYPKLSGKKIVLYAPTFRDEEYNTSEIKIHLDIDKLMSNLDDNYVLGLRLHPRISDKVNINEYSTPYQDRVFDFSGYNKLNTLLICSDILITDYSSIIYEYTLMKKPMIFYSYDLSTFEKSGRGFYEDYKTAVPGPVIFNTEQIADIIKNYPADEYNIDKFLDIYLENCDGNSRKRLYDLLMA